MTHQNSEKGSAIVYVFVGITLFGALMFLFSRGASQNSSGFTKQQSTIKAQAVIQYGDSVANAVNRLIANGISENDISFETDFFKKQDGTIINTASVFPNCTNEKCKVFNPKGGRAVAQYPTDLGPLDPASPAYFPPRGALIAHTFHIIDVGTSLPELVLSFHTIPKDVCIEINNLLNNKFTTNPPVGNYTSVTEDYVGAFPSGTMTLGDSDDAWAAGKSAYCYKFQVTTPDMYIYQKVAITR